MQSAEASVPRRKPYNLEAEMACLGAIFMRRGVADTIFARVKPEDFFDGRNRAVAECIRDLLAKQPNAPVDLITVTEALKAEGRLNQAGGIEYLDKLLDGVPTATHAERYAEMVREKSTLRALLDVSNKISEFASEGELTVSEALDRSQQVLFEIARSNYSDYTDLKTVTHETIEHLEKLFKNKGQNTAVETGFRDLDKVLGGLHEGNLIIIGGRPSMGKTAFALSILENISIRAERRIGSAFFSLEMSRLEIALRLLCSQSRIPHDHFRANSLSDNDWPRLFKAAQNMQSASVFIDDSPGLTLHELSSKARRMVQDGARVLMVDYIQLMNSHNEEISREQQIAYISRGLKRLARELSVPIIALTQLNRANEKREEKKPMLSDIRESGSIEQDADVVLFVHRQEVYEKDEQKKEPHRNQADIVVAKNRHGPPNDVKLFFQGAFTRFENLETRPTEH